MKKLHWTLLAVSIIFSACEKEEESIAALSTHTQQPDERKKPVIFDLERFKKVNKLHPMGRKEEDHNDYAELMRCIDTLLDNNDERI